jgi:hypothetical protein
MPEAILHRYCLRCKRKLKSQKSMELGYGPVCHQKVLAKQAQSEILGGEVVA